MLALILDFLTGLLVPGIILLIFLFIVHCVYAYRDSKTVLSEDMNKASGGIFDNIGRFLFSYVYKVLVTAGLLIIIPPLFVIIFLYTTIQLFVIGVRMMVTSMIEVVKTRYEGLDFENKIIDIFYEICKAKTIKLVQFLLSPFSWWFRGVKVSDIKAAIELEKEIYKRYDPYITMMLLVIVGMWGIGLAVLTKYSFEQYFQQIFPQEIPFTEDEPVSIMQSSIHMLAIQTHENPHYALSTREKNKVKAPLKTSLVEKNTKKESARPLAPLIKGRIIFCTSCRQRLNIYVNNSRVGSIRRDNLVGNHCAPPFGLAHELPAGTYKIGVKDTANRQLTSFSQEVFKDSLIFCRIPCS